jgi:saccharopine dehydrogenase-like NADP-dependent oxidoreductase
MLALKVLGMLQSEAFTENIRTWDDYISMKYNQTVIPENSLEKIKHILEQDGNVKVIDEVLRALEWLEIFDNQSNSVLSKSNPMDSICTVLEKKLCYDRTERDMVAMFHTVIGKTAQGKIEKHTSRLLDFGSTDLNGDTAMSRTVGYTVAIGAELILNGKIKLRGCHIPIHKSIYVPVLERLQQLGLTWSDQLESNASSS